MKYIIMLVLCCPLILYAEAEKTVSNSELNLSDDAQSFHYGYYPFYPLSHRGFYYPYYNSYDPYGYYSYSHSFCPHCGSYSCPMMGKHKMMMKDNKIIIKDNNLKDVE